MSESTGVVISFAEAKARLARRRQEWREGAERWFAELETWPAAFRQKLHSRLEFELDPNLTPNQVDCGMGQLLSCREAGEGDRRRLLYWLYRWRLVIRRCAESVREARRRGMKSYAIERRVANIRWAQHEVLWLLFQFGHRTVPRSALKPLARAENEEELTLNKSRLSSLRQEIARLRSLISGGVYVIGRKKGQPYTAQRRAQLRHTLKGLELEFSHACERVRVLETEPDPLRACGLYERPEAQGAASA